MNKKDFCSWSFILLVSIRKAKHHRKCSYVFFLVFCLPFCAAGSLTTMKSQQFIGTCVCVYGTVPHKSHLWPHRSFTGTAENPKITLCTWLLLGDPFTPVPTHPNVRLMAWYELEKQMDVLNRSPESVRKQTCTGVFVDALVLKGFF